jgi:hypothetical protein
MFEGTKPLAHHVKVQKRITFRDYFPEETYNEKVI